MRISVINARTLSWAVIISGLFAAAPVANADDHGWYVGAGVTGLQTTLDYGYTEKYSTTHARVSVGYQFFRFFSVEGRLMSPASDTDIDYLGGQYKFETGTVFGIYARPHTNFKSANVYGIVGLTSMNTTYRGVGFGPSDGDTLLLGTLGVGGSFTLVNNLFLEIEAQLYAGTANYKSYYPDYIDVYTTALGATLRYRF